MQKNLTDEQIRGQIHERLVQLPELHADQLEIDIEGGVVTLQGAVPSEDTKGRLVELVKGVPCVREIRMQMRVGTKPN